MAQHPNDRDEFPTGLLLAAPAVVFFLAGMVNTATYAAVIGIAVYIPVLIRRRRQREKDFRPGGYCRECGYDLRSSPDRCPECGTPHEFKP